MKKFLMGVGVGIILTCALSMTVLQYRAARARYAAVVAEAAAKAVAQAPAR
jgi:predicted small secreted protein